MLTVDSGSYPRHCGDPLNVERAKVSGMDDVRVNPAYDLEQTPIGCKIFARPFADSDDPGAMLLDSAAEFLPDFSHRNDELRKSTLRQVVQQVCYAVLEAAEVESMHDMGNYWRSVTLPLHHRT
jgi:hypothetical protein